MSKEDVTRILAAAQSGQAHAAEELLPLVYQELKVAAASRFRRLPPGVTLQPTALVHEAFLRLVGDDSAVYENRGHFFFAAARAMRDILVEQARHKATQKRGGHLQRKSPVHLDAAFEAPAEDMLGLHEALEQLEQEYPRQYQVVMLRFFAGLTESECAELLEVDRSTLTRDWRFVRAWLYRFLEPEAFQGDE